MSYTVSLTRNPNLSAPQVDRSSQNEVLEKFGQKWWTGLAPEQCLGFDRAQKVLHALPLLNLNIATREDILAYFDNTWTLTEVLFSSLKSESTYVRPPYHQLRHPLIFYYGHPAVLYLNKLRLAGLIKDPVDLYLEKVLETGVDEMSWDDMSKNEMAWPSVETVHAYRKKIYNLIKELILTHPALDTQSMDQRGPKSALWSLFMGMEHEKIHFETSSVLIRELPIELVETPRYWPQLASTRTPQHIVKPVAGEHFPQNSWISIRGQKVSWGKDSNTPSYGWDNEYGVRTKTIVDFETTQNLITNGEYYAFVSSLAYSEDKYWSQEGLQWRKFRNTKRPTFWVAYGPEGLHDYKLRTIFEIIDMPWDWPAEVNFHEAQAFCRWKQEQDKSNLTYRLITEPEHVALRDDQEDVVLQSRAYKSYDELVYPYNFNFTKASASPVDSYPANSKDIRDVFGNVWQWAEDQFNPLDNFSVHPLYDDFSTPCFDGKHQMILGGSFISCGHEASRYARFHFRPHFFQHAGFRISRSLDGSADNGSTKLLQNQQYVHPKRAYVLDQMQNENWWKNVDQPLELNTQELQSIWGAASQQIIQFESQLKDIAPMGESLDPATNDTRKGFTVPFQATKQFPERPEPIDKLLHQVFTELAPLGQQPGQPGYMAYVAGAGNSISNLAQAIGQTINQFTGHYNMSPGLVTLEAEALKWFMDLFGFDTSTSGAIFTTGGSLANLQALTIARDTKLKGHNLALAKFYASEHVHHCVGKALAFLGFPKESLELIPLNEQFKMNSNILEQRIQSDLAQGKTPVAIIGTAGSTNTGTVDDLETLSVLAKKHDLWFHVDGAYGALFQLTLKGQKVLKGISQADSIALDPHKGLALPYGTGCLIVRDRKKMNISFAGASTYMPPSAGLESNEFHVDFADIGPELSRDFRGLRVWLPIKHFGIGPFKLNLEEKIALSEYLAKELKQISDIEVFSEPQLSILTFTHKDKSKTRNLMTKINQKNHVFLSGCKIQETFVIRVCLLGFRCHFEQVQTLLADLKSALKDV